MRDDHQALLKITEGSATLPANALVVLPRTGTISPWSSKASDIARICGLDGVVKRVERGVIYVLHPQPGSSLDARDWQV